MANDWYLIKDGKKVGPLSSQQLKSLAANGTLNPSDLVWKEGLSAVVVAEKVKGLFESKENPEPKESSVQPNRIAQGIYWYYVSDSKQIGPVPTEEMLDLIKTKRLQAKDLVWNESLTDWVTASAAVELSKAFSSLPSAASATAMGGVYSGILEETKVNLSNGQANPVEVESRAIVTSDADTTQIEEPLRKPRGIEEQDIVFECLAEYRGGHPTQTEAGRGILYLTKAGLCFVADQPQLDITIAPKQIIDIMPPVPGSHSSEMIAKAEQAQALSGMGRQLSSFAGALVGGIGGAAIRAIGTSASGVTSSKNILGPLPKNRLVAIVSENGAKHKVIFDIMASDKQEMEELASSFWRKTASVRSTFASSGAMATRKNSPMQSTPSFNRNDYLVLKSGVSIGPLTSDKLMEMLDRGEVSSHDLVRVEAWIPIYAINLLNPRMLNEIGNISMSTNQKSRNHHQSMESVVSVDEQNQKATSTKAIAAGVGGLVAGAAIATALTPGTASASQEFVPNPGHGIQGVVLDTNHDGRADTAGLDLNDDGKIDAVAVDSDYDGQIDAVAIDSDNDGVLDAYAVDSNDDGEVDTYGFDTDGDGQVDVIDHEDGGDAEVDDFGSDDMEF